MVCSAPSSGSTAWEITLHLISENGSQMGVFIISKQCKGHRSDHLIKIFQHYFVNFVFCVSVCRYVPMSAEGASNPPHL